MVGGQSGKALQAGKALRVLCLVCAIGALDACAKKTTPQTDDLTQYTAEQLYTQGEVALANNKRKPEDALRYFQEVEQQYPYCLLYTSRCV